MGRGYPPRCTANSRDECGWKSPDNGIIAAVSWSEALSKLKTPRFVADARSGEFDILAKPVRYPEDYLLVHGVA